MAEVSLRNARRVDVMGLAENGEIIVVEIKSSLADFQSDHKWQDYLDFADRFFFAVDQAFPAHVLPDDEGLIIADEYGGAVIRDAKIRKVAAARRKSLSLRFGRMAALRLNDINDPRRPLA